MKKLLLVLLFSPLVSLSQGLIPISKEEYNKIQSAKTDNTFGFTESSTPSSYSLEKYVPTVISQYSSNACTGFSILYYGLSTQYNSMLSITDPVDKIGHSFDPYFAYSIINDNASKSRDKCDATNTMIAVLDILKSKGAKKQFYSPHMECYTSSNLLNSNIEKYINPYSIDSYNKIASLGSDIAVNQTKRIINDNKPVMFAMITTKSLRGVKINGDYSPTSLELSHIKKTLSNWYEKKLTENEIEIFKNEHMPHALTIVGYDDNKYGGSFRVVNSWGEQWGDGGYFWFKYKDFKFLTLGAYTLNLSSKIKRNENPQFNFNGYQRLTYDDNSSYEGLVSQGLPNGKGIYSYDTEQLGRVNSIGEWKDGKRNGFFTFTSKDEIFTGTYKDDVYIKKLNTFGFTEDDDKDDDKKKEEDFKEYLRKMGVKKIPISRTVIVKSFKKA